MEQKKLNQEHGRKYFGSSSFGSAREPSKAPRQDEQDAEPTETSEVNRQYPDAESKQGISNRPAVEEHAFPEPFEPTDGADAPDSVEATPKQIGGNRGGV